MLLTATAIETHEEGNVTYYGSDKAGYIPIMSDGKIPYVWPEDLKPEDNCRQGREKKKLNNWKITFYRLLDQSLIHKIYIIYIVILFEMKRILTSYSDTQILTRKTFWSKKLGEKRNDETQKSKKEHESLVSILKNRELGNYIWIDGQPLYKLEEGKYIATDQALSKQEVQKYKKQNKDKIFNANKENFQDYINKDWSMKAKDSERRIKK